MGREAPTAAKAAGRAGIEELQTCKKCGNSTRLPRYNSPAHLLDSRTGRCGEWANALTLCCLTLGLEARLATDWTDQE